MAKFYVVWKGRETGMFSDWATCKKQVDQFPGARYKSFPTKIEAEQAFSGSAKAPSHQSTHNKPTPGTRAKSVVKKSKPAALTDEKIMAMPFDIKIFTDGACEPNPGEAGSGLAIYQSNKLYELWYGIYQAHGTNNTAELNALYQSLLIGKQYLQQNKTVSIFSDSSYSIQCITTWAKGWASHNWQRKGGEIKNVELIKEMYALYQTMSHQIAIHHVNGHVGVEGNELADRMSILAIEKQQQSLTLYSDPLDVESILERRRG
ncbi:ribonuclease H family protein [Vibrio sp. TH_r3]|uniref:ribonuclease H family protein n=1 Tax=Vibrio sp. TH_r3 TaxID=3082084 RepID=UPI002955A721|nr:ribonuclease H family protein [Vibrio sp. TH_r3]MDV7103279.1 ribonuclease H family protein [Vibrio sp. TH_r3]